MLHRAGRKTKLLPKLLSLFPNDIDCFIDLFMGSGAVTFAMVPKVKYVISNDIEEDIFNLFIVLKEQSNELIDKIITTPVHESIFKYWKKHCEETAVYRAIRFLYLSNYSIYGNFETMTQGCYNEKNILLENINKHLDLIYKPRYLCSDFRDVFNKFGFGPKEMNKSKCLIYADPPYLETDNKYNNHFTLKDTQDLFELLVNFNTKFAISEFDNPIILDLAKSYGLNVINLGERRNIFNRRIEILITNYAVCDKPINQIEIKI